MCSLEKRGNLFILTLTGSDEHRLNPTLLDAIKSALHRVRSEATASSALITTAHGKFFSNGLDLDWAKSGGPEINPRIQLMGSKLRSIVKDLISLPLPTIAAVTGHASAAGMIFVVSHDYVVMRRDRGFLYMSELDVDLPIPPWATAVIRAKIGPAAALRDVLLRSAKLTAAEAAKLGIVESAHDGAEETVRAAVRLGEELLRRKWDGHVYGQIRMEMFSDLLRALDFSENHVASRL
ncbi:Enoyl-CoA delta isomerase 1, peroxisomal like [Actinidia chinensis var. chinensis]|uniref:Delta(3)-Delta(2)-enoyl-CoA isomerase n=1 Tax=Actinidia chinensis var. chinensis TaxID=1590841 RepID=A0A2R6RWY9_ACTCC|nr:Enoyl-CoA delta isomerase 1, peroxisomal like [Actinidia chinensis var. chinensis]